MIDHRQKRMNHELKVLVTKLEEAGFAVNVDDDSIWKTGEVLKDGKIVAKFRMTTGTGYHSYFTGWRLQCPGWEPRGRYERDRYLEAPESPHYWGSRNFQGATSIVAKVKEQLSSLPTSEQIELAALNRKFREDLRDVKRKVESACAILHDEETVRAMVNLLDSDRLTEKLRRKVDRVKAHLNQIDCMRSALRQLDDKIDELTEAEENRH